MLRRSNHGHTEAQATAQDHLHRLTVARSSVGTTPSALTDDQLVLLTTDGVHDILGHDRLAALVREHQHDAKELADALVAGTGATARPAMTTTTSPP